MPDAIVIGAGPERADRRERARRRRAGRPRARGPGPRPAAPSAAASSSSPASPATCSAPSIRSGIASPHLRGARPGGPRPRVGARAGGASPTRRATARCATLYRDVERTAASRRARSPPATPTRGAASAERWLSVQPAFVDVAHAARSRPSGGRAGPASGGSARPKEVLDFARLGVMPLRRHAEEEFARRRARRGCSPATRCTPTSRPDSAGSALYGWVLCGIGQSLGWPVAARRRAGDHRRARRPAALAGAASCAAASEVTEIVVRGGRATGVRTAGGDRAPGAPRAILADTGAAGAVRADAPARAPRRAASASSCDNATVKVDWSLDGPIPWMHEEARAGRHGPRHRGPGRAERPRRRARPRRPARASRSCCSASTRATTRARCPEGKEVAWAYTHVPQGVWREELHRAVRRPAWRSRSSASRPASASSSASGTSSRRRRSRRPTRTSSAARSTAAPRRSTSSSSSARRRASGAPRPTSTGCTSRRPQRTRAAASTGPAGRTPRARRCTRRPETRTSRGPDPCLADRPCGQDARVHRRIGSWVVPLCMLVAACTAAPAAAAPPWTAPAGRAGVRATNARPPVARAGLAGRRPARLGGDGGPLDVGDRRRRARRPGHLGRAHRP